MQLTGIQFDINWGDKQANYDQVDTMIAEQKPEPGSMIVLPEMFATGFDMDVASIYEEEFGQTEQFLSDLAKRTSCTVVGGLVGRCKTDSRGINLSMAYGADGAGLCRYQKIKPFTLGGELEAYEAGNDIVFFDWNGFKVAPFICYDLRFPELMRKAVAQGAEMFVFIASWPSKRLFHWTRLLQARAIENQSYVIGVNRVGNDPNYEYAGGTEIFDYCGRSLSDAGAETGWVRADVDRDEQMTFRKELPFLNDQ